MQRLFFINVNIIIIFKGLASPKSLKAFGIIVEAFKHPSSPSFLLPSPSPK